jgi:hypothetical protein
MSTGLRRLWPVLLLGGAVRLHAQVLRTPAAAHAHARLDPVAVSATETTLLLTLTVDDGWHVSWRNPGETGLPTRFAWNLPAAVRVAHETWPVPTVTRTDAGVTHTLEGSVPWLFQVITDAAAPADRLVRVTIRYGVCREVCIPEQLTVDGVLPAVSSAAPLRTHIAPDVRQRLLTDGDAVPARRLASGALCLAAVPAVLRVAPVMLITESARHAAGAVGGQVTTRGVARFPLPAAAYLAAAHDTVVLVGGGAGVRLPLDFRPTVPGCADRR